MHLVETMATRGLILMIHLFNIHNIATMYQLISHKVISYHCFHSQQLMRWNIIVDSPVIALVDGI